MEHAGTTEITKEEAQRLEVMGSWLSGTWRGRFYSAAINGILFVESFIWTVMDLVRAGRMRLAHRMNRQAQKAAEQNK